jgi:hypothetical protein
LLPRRVQGTDIGIDLAQIAHQIDRYRHRHGTPRLDLFGCQAG